MDAESVQARRQLEQILSNPEFGQPFNMKQIFGDNWAGYFPQDAIGFSTIVEWIGYICMGLMIVGVLGGLLFYVWKRHKRSKRDQEKSKTINIQEVLLAEIKELANRGDYQIALQKCFLFLLQKLADQQSIHFAKTKTNGEYRTFLSKNRPELAKDFVKLSEQFDQVCYGEQQVGLQDYDTYQRQVFVFLGKEAQDEKS